jgi:hypothetical protein
MSPTVLKARQASKIAEIGAALQGTEEKAVLGVGKCQEGTPCRIEAYVSVAKLPKSFTSEMCSKSLEYPNCYPPFLIRKVISSRVLNQPDGMSARELQSDGK